MWKGGSDKMIRDRRTKSCHPYWVAWNGPETGMNVSWNEAVDEDRRDRATLTVSASARIYAFQLKGNPQSYVK